MPDQQKKQRFSRVTKGTQKAHLKGMSKSAASPAQERVQNRQAAIERILKRSQRLSLNGLSIRELINTGRK